MLTCQRCGTSLIGKTAGTKWCSRCSNIVRTERERAHNQYVKDLVSRDKALPPINGRCICGQPVSAAATFCSSCGQRLFKEVE